MIASLSPSVAMSALYECQKFLTPAQLGTYYPGFQAWQLFQFKQWEIKSYVSYLPMKNY